jgi:hypothetical protein
MPTKAIFQNANISIFSINEQIKELGRVRFPKKSQTLPKNK